MFAIPTIQSGIFIKRTLASAAAATGITYGGGKFLINPALLGNGWTSTDGKSFTRDAIFSAPISIDQTTYDADNSQFIAVGQGVSGGGYAGMFTSPDGNAWTSRFDASQPNPSAVCWDTGLGIGVAVSFDSSNTIRYWTSNAAGTSWSSGTDTVTGVNSISSMACNNSSLLVAVGSSGGIYSSPDGTNWTKETPAASYSGEFNQIIYDGTRFVALGNDGEVQYSTDGSSWSQGTATGFSGSRAIAFGATTYVVVGGAGQVFFSKNIISGSWIELTNVTPATTAQFNDIISDGSDFFVGVMNGPDYVYSGIVL